MLETAVEKLTICDERIGTIQAKPDANAVITAILEPLLQYGSTAQVGTGEKPAGYVALKTIMQAFLIDIFAL